jgi:CTP:molybdopterin cytidylyltransferase MocA
VLDALRQSPVERIVVVEGAYRLDQAPGSRFEPGAEVPVVHCEDWERGPGASLRCGLAALGDDITHALVVLADGPELDPRAVARLVEHRHDGPVLAATYDGTRDHPVLLAREAWAEIPDEGGRALTPRLVDCSDLTPPGDVDYPLS